MIKKIMAVLVAISCAFGAWADMPGHLNGTDFSERGLGEFLTGRDDTGAATESTYWFNGATNDFSGNIVLGTNDTDHVLDFESNITNPLYRTINNCYGFTSPSQFQATPIGTGLFIDTHVQFTPYLVNENHPAPTGSGEDKLIVWVRETEVDGDANLTNLIVTAGYVAGNGIVTASNYVVNLSQAQASALCSGQHRLTIKSYENITDYNSQGVDYYIMGFVVYIDEAVVDYPDASIALNVVPGPRQYYSTDGHNKLFASLMPAGSGTISNYSKLSAVGYAGMGKIGDVIFDSYNTTYPAFAGDDLSFEVRPGDGVTSFDYLGVTYNGGTNCFFTVDATATSVTISNVLYDTTAGYKHKTGTWHNNVAVDNQVGVGGDYGTFLFANGTILTLVGFQANYIVNGEEYDNLAAAKADALAGSYPLVLNNNVVIDEGTGEFACCLYVADGETLVLDLNGHTIKGSGDQHATIVNDGGTLTITDTSANKDGKVLEGDSEFCLISYNGSSTTLDAGIYENIDDMDGDPTTITINSGTYKDANATGPSSTFYLEDCIASGGVTDWNQIGGYWYATVGGSAPAGTVIYLTMGSGVDSLSTSFNGTDWTAYTDALQDVELGSTLYIKGTSSVAGYEVPQFSIVVDDTHATEQTALVVNKSAIVYFPQTSIEEQWADRNGTAALPFVIRNYADLVALKNGVANGTITNQCFEQVANIDMDGEEPWAGIGTFECRTAGSGAFEGTYDGGNYAISNVTFDQHEYNGIFASVVGGVIKNLTVDVDGFAATSAFGGAAIAGVAKNCFLTNLVATGTIIGQSSTPCTHSAAGIAVRMEGTVAYACTNRCEIWSGKGKLGGIAAMGQGDRADSLILCSNEGDIHGTKTGGLGDGGVGGIFGYQGYGDGYQAVTYTNCRNIGQVTSLSSDKTGSILGHHSNSGPSFVGTIITLDNMLVSGYSEGSDGVTYGKSIGNGLVELCTQAAFETNNTYSTLYSGLTPTFEFSAPGTIAFNTNLFQATAFAITATGIDVTESESGGIVTFTAGSSDPWAPAAETDEAAAAKAAELFGAESEVAANVDTLAEYNALVTYIKSVTSQSEVPTDLTADQKTWMWKSFILGADPLFVAEPEVEITSLTANATAGKWDFIVKVTEGELTTAHSVAAAKVAALVKVTDSLSPASWSAPDPDDVHADLAPLLGTNLIKVTVDFGTDTSGFMKVSE